ncbi:MAG: rRNA maturation RNase YbeY [Phycisphaerales bacterium]|nr:rRNA maturation RNase YbeY [Phycisphaerales bacterium]
MNETADEDIVPQRIVDALRAVLQQHDRPTCTLSVALVDDARMSDLHEQYLGISGTTDVLTFDLDESDPDVVDGEIIICADTARRESAARGHAVADEILLYAVHGCLHLLGYDDHDADEAAAMHAREDELLALVGVGPVYRRSAS